MSINKHKQMHESFYCLFLARWELFLTDQSKFGYNANCFVLFFFLFLLRMIIHWPAFLCWVTRSPSPRSLKTSTRTTSSNCISSPTSTISDQRANTLLRGTDARWLNVSAALFGRGCQRGWFKNCVLCPQVDGGHPQCHDPLQCRSCPEQQRVPSSLKSAHLVSTHRLPRVALCPSCPHPHPTDSLLFFSTHIWDICTCVHAHLVLFNALMVTCPLV